MSTFVIGDIHGGLKGLKQLLSRIKISSDDIFIFLGDYVDGWSESAQVIEYLMEFSKSHECVFIKGNHDVWCEDWLRTKKADTVWLNHGGEAAIDSYSNVSKNEKQNHLEFFQNMKLYHLDEKNRLFIHAGFTSMHGVEKEIFESTFYFDRTLWETALTMDKRVKRDSKKFPNRLKHYDEIYIGHTPTLNYDWTVPMQSMNVWNVDTGAAFFGKLSAIDINSKEVFQSSVLMELYPDEKGRNQMSLNEFLDE